MDLKEKFMTNDTRKECSFSVAEIEAMKKCNSNGFVGDYLNQVYKGKEDMVNHPSHYINGNRETIDTIKDVTGEGFDPYLVGNILKYIGQYKYKNEVEDLHKCLWYLGRLIQENGDKK